MPDKGERDSDQGDFLREKIRSMSECVADIKDRMRDVERRMRELETDHMERIRRSIYDLENHVSNFKVTSENHKERWKMALNFIVQLVWVVMASYVLTKLGLGVGPV